MQFTAEIIANFLGGTIQGDPSATVTTVAKIEEATEGSLVFLSNPKYEEYVYTTGATIVMVNNDFVLKHDICPTIIRVPNAYKAFASLLDLYVANKPRKTGIQTLASIDPSASVSPDAYIGQYTVIGENVCIGTNAQIYPQVYIGDRVAIGNNVMLYPGVRIYEECVIGDNVTIHGGTTIGSDGFGFAPTDDGSFQKIPQIGNVVIEDNVEIGSNCCIDRATMGSTVIKKGVKLDNLIQIAHNVVIGENTVMAAQCGVAGSTKIGKNVMMGGQVGIIGHLSITDNVKIGSQSGIGHDVTTDGEVLLGSPAMNGLQNHRVQAILKQLPELRKTILDTARQVKKLSDNK